MTVKISAKLADDEQALNGLEAIRDQLIDDPTVRHVVVAEIECLRITEEVGKGATKTPTVRIVRIEALDSSDAVAARQMLGDKYADRTGRAELPLGDLETDEDVDSVFVEDDDEDQGDDEAETAGERP